MNIYLDSIGCRLNQSEIEKFGNQFRLAGHILVDNPADADMVVVNTCAVTSQAASDSRGKIRQAGRAGQSEIIVTGCWATLDPQGAASLPSVTKIVLNDQKDDLAAQAIGNSLRQIDKQPTLRQSLPGSHLRTRAFIKAQDGCNNHCTYCLTRLVRGQSRSQSIEGVLSDIHAAYNGGAQEVVLTGVQLGSWGQDFDPPIHLSVLIQTILRETDIHRIRLSSLEPWNLDDNFFVLWEDKRLCRQLHLPLQSGSAATLKRMGRKTSPAQFASLVKKARQISPEIAITTDMLVGFPGEDESEFEQSLKYVQQIEFAGGHVFNFSPRPGTAAARMLNPVPPQVRKERSARMRALLADAHGQYCKRFVGESLYVLWETSIPIGEKGWLLEGLTDNYLRVKAFSAVKLWNEFSRVEIDELISDGLFGRIVTE
jgi:threonylcarbamoyladenosine tRNA methylthiotransferase MtaB